MLGRDRFKRFWKVVDAVQWGRDCEDIDEDVLKLRLHKACEEQSFTLDEAYDVLHELRAPIYRFIWRDAWANPERWNSFMSDDGIQDLVNHVVGCGKEVWQREAKNGAALAERYYGNKFSESFAYLFLADEDFLPGIGDENALVSEGKSDQT